jgi:uncharacterized protein (DUF433 family)
VITSAIYQAYQAEQSPQEIARWLELPLASIRAAIDFEKQLAA